MAKNPGKHRHGGAPHEDVDVLLKAELRRRGLSEAEIKAATRKKKRRKALEFAAVIHPRRAMTPSSWGAAGDELCTVEFAAGQLKLHPKTVLRFIRENRLRATRVGKSYRILRADLDAFGGVPARAQAPLEPARATSIVEIAGVDAVLARKWGEAVQAVLSAGGGTRADLIHDADRAHLKIVVTGSPGDTARLLSLIQTWTEQLAP